jgi:hypothetical protein
VLQIFYSPSVGEKRSRIFYEYKEEMLSGRPLNRYTINHFFPYLTIAHADPGEGGSFI